MLIQPAIQPGIRPALEDDLPAIKAIYDHQAQTGTATFHVEGPALDYWQQRLASEETGDHFLVAEDTGDVLGCAYSSTYRPRLAYQNTRETAVYLDEAARGRGVGRQLYDALLGRLRADGVRTVLAVVALPNDASRALHLACGFTSVGVLHEVGFKFGRWIDTELWELSLRQR